MSDHPSPNDLPPGSRSAGHLAYGAYQLASSEAGGRQVQAFLKSPEGARWSGQFKGMDPAQAL